MNPETHHPVDGSREPTWLTAPPVRVEENAAFCNLSNAVHGAADRLLLMTNSQLPEATSVTFGPLQNTIEGCLSLCGMPRNTFAWDEDLFKSWDEMMSSRLPLPGLSIEDSKPVTEYEKARRAHVTMITRAGLLLLPIARSYNYAAQDEMLSRVNAFCKGERDWYLASKPILSLTSKRPWDRISQVNDAMAQFEALPIVTQKSMEGTLASILLRELSRPTPVSPYGDAKSLLLATLSAAKPRSPDEVTGPDKQKRLPRKCRHDSDYNSVFRTYTTLKNSINKTCRLVQRDDYTPSPTTLEAMGVPWQLVWPLEQTVARTDPRILAMHKANSQHYRQWLQNTTHILPAVDTLYRTAGALRDAKLGDLGVVTSLLRESVWHLDHTRYGKEDGTRYTSDALPGSLESLCQQAEDALTLIEGTHRQQGGVPTEIWDRREYQEAPGEVNRPGGDWKFACSALLECALSHLEGSWETASDESEPVSRLGIAQ